jgi:hypothetical protein
MAAQTAAQVVRQIENIKRKLVAQGDMRPGTLSTQYNVCGTPGCQCKAEPSKKHGPYSGQLYEKGKGQQQILSQGGLGGDHEAR